MSFPIVIVGGGTAGSTAALHLAAQTTRPIVVCEPGNISHHDDDSRFFAVLADRSLTRSEFVHVGSRTREYVQANAVGGGSAINGMLLSGVEPAYLHGLTSVPHRDRVGDVSQALFHEGGRLCRLWWNNGRWNPGRALLHLVEEGRVEWKKEAVTRLVLESDSVVSVECGHTVVRTDCVVLAAGAIASPRLLMSSGIASLVSDLGNGVQDHPCISFSLHRETQNHGQFDAAVVKDITVGVDGLGLIVAYERESDVRDSHAVVSVMLMNPDSRGAMSETSHGIHLDLGLLSTERDIAVMRALVRETVVVLQAESFATVATSIVGGAHGTDLHRLLQMSDSELDAWIRAEVEPVSHVASTLSQSVDERGRLRGVSGVVVVDASVLPSVPPETPAAAVTMEARRICQLLGEELT